MSKTKSFSIKSINTIRKNNNHLSSLDDIADNFVGITNNEEYEKKEETKELPTKQLPLMDESRFTVVIPNYLHTRIKKHCAINGIPMKNALTKILLKEFPEK